MSDFDALLKRSFAEAPEPVDDGFTVNVGQAVARHEHGLKIRAAFQVVAVTIACGAVAFGGYAVLSAVAPGAFDWLGDEAGRVQGALSTAPSMNDAAQNIMQSLSAGMTQILLLSAAAVAGGAVAYRATQD